MSFHRYDLDSDVHSVDCGGKVELETGWLSSGGAEEELP